MCTHVRSSDNRVLRANSHRTIQQYVGAKKGKGEAFLFDRVDVAGLGIFYLLPSVISEPGYRRVERREVAKADYVSVKGQVR